MARARGLKTLALSVHYGQRHLAELDAARRVAAALGADEHRVMSVDLAGIGGSALTDPAVPIPESAAAGIPVTYVPARNTLLLALALGWAEVAGAAISSSASMRWIIRAIRIAGPEFIEAFERLALLATKAGVEGAHVHIEAPLIALSKAEIIRAGIALGVDYGMTVSCYQADGEGRACGRCDSCRLRAAGFAEARYRRIPPAIA